MGLAASSSADDCELPSDKHEATIYYFSGRGLADQIRWMLAASQISFTQKIISQRSQLLRMSTRQLPFGQLPLLQIDGIEIVQSQSAIRYLAKRAGLQGKNDEEVLKCDMIVEAVRDLLGLVTDAPIARVKARRLKQQKEKETLPIAPSATSSSASTTTSPSNISPTAVVVNPENSSPSNTVTASASPASSTHLPTTAPTTTPAPSSAPSLNDAWGEHLNLMKDKWEFYGSRFEAIIRANQRSLNSSSATSSTAADSSNASSSSSAPKGAVPGVVYDPNAQYFLVGNSLTYADILVAHITTWFVEECGHEIVSKMPFLVHLQNQVISLPGIKQFIKSVHYFPLGDEAYVEQVSKVLGRNLLK
mmetsp:Transcript_25440/g.27809  ORF Transcript_25440/g.27809 Transcript_25440/m.27809 type:complete len:362 (+) Transcript_25440:83-1168(+)